MEGGIVLLDICVLLAVMDCERVCERVSEPLRDDDCEGTPEMLGEGDGLRVPVALDVDVALAAADELPVCVCERVAADCVELGVSVSVWLGDCVCVSEGVALSLAVRVRDSEPVPVALGDADVLCAPVSLGIPVCEGVSEALGVSVCVSLPVSDWGREDVRLRVSD